MKLKILLMPVAILISLILIIWHIYPTWFSVEPTSISTTKAEIAKLEKEISDIKEGKGNVQKLSQSLDSNTEVVELINKFYPTYRNDEDVVSSLNNIAFTEGIFLVNMGVDYRSIGESDNIINILSLPVQKNEVIVDSSQMALDGSVSIAEVGADGALGEAKMDAKFIETTLEIYGSYEQIKNFSTSLSKAGLINNIQSFKVYKKEKQGETEEGEGGDANVLNMDMVVGFAYLPTVNAKTDALLLKDLFKSSEFDFASISDRKNILTGNYKKSEVGETGLANPFIKEGAAE